MEIGWVGWSAPEPEPILFPVSFLHLLKKEGSFDGLTIAFPWSHNSLPLYRLIDLILHSYTFGRAVFSLLTDGPWIKKSYLSLIFLDKMLSSPYFEEWNQQRQIILYWRERRRKQKEKAEPTPFLPFSFLCLNCQREEGTTHHSPFLSIYSIN